MSMNKILADLLFITANIFKYLCLIILSPWLFAGYIFSGFIEGLLEVTLKEWYVSMVETSRKLRSK